MQRSDFKFFLELPVRWGDMDAFSHVNNVQYLRYLESGRIAYLEHLGKDLQNTAESAARHIILADIQCSFLHQLHYPAVVEIGTRTSHIGNSSFRLSCAIYKKGETAPVATCKAVLVWFDFTAQRPRPVPRSLREIIANFETIAPTR